MHLCIYFRKLHIQSAAEPVAVLFHKAEKTRKEGSPLYTILLQIDPDLMQKGGRHNIFIVPEMYSAEAHTYHRSTSVSLQS